MRADQLLWRSRSAIARFRNQRRGTPSARWAWTGSGPPPVRGDAPELSDAAAPDPHVDPARPLDRWVLEQLDALAAEPARASGWSLGSVERRRLGAISLHYHGWAAELAACAAAGDRHAGARCRRLLGGWLDACRLETPGSLALAWNSFAVATRLIWWSRLRWRGGQAVFGDDPILGRRFLASAWCQAAFLADHLEWEHRGNHLLRDLVGLAHAGRLFDHPQADGWLARAVHLAKHQLAEQVLPDGGHCEGSPKYELDVLKDVLALRDLAPEAADRELFAATARAIAEHLSWLRLPDGDLVQLNDGCRVGPTRVSAALGAAGVADPVSGGRDLAESGVAVWHGDPWTVAFDVGEFGARWTPAHGHADCTTFECCFAGRRLISDPGTLDYDDGPSRAYDRSTAAHNTVCIDGADSSEVWKIFRVGRRARPLAVDVEIAADGLAARAGHDGYDRLPGRPRPFRTLEVRDRGALRIADRVERAAGHRITAGFLVEPGWSVENLANGWILAGEPGRIRVEVDGPDGLVTTVERRPLHPEYGVETLADRLVWEWDGPAETLAVRSTFTPMA